MSSARNLILAAGLMLAAGLTVGVNAAAAVPRSGTQQSSHDRIDAYWTAQRRASAIPRDVTRPAARGKGGGNKPGHGGGHGGGPGGVGTGGVVTGATWADSSAPVVKTTGKVYFTMGGANYVCSGSAVAGSVNLVLTAGHCVWDDADGYATNWMFWPAYDNGNKPYGTWTASALFTTDGWHMAGGRDFPNDAGIAVVSDGSGRELATVLGSLPAMGDSTTASGTTFSAFGYPAAKKYKGGTLTYCEGPGELGYDGDQETVSIACDMTGGSSGGPWYDASGGTGEITSLNSYGYGGLNRMFGPTFDGQEAAAFTAADDGVCSSGEVCAPQ